MCMIFLTLTNAYVGKSMLLTLKSNRNLLFNNFTLLKPLLNTHLSATCSVSKFWAYYVVT